MNKHVEDHQILSAVADLTATHGYPPTYQEVAAHVGLSSRGTVFTRVQELREKKLMEPAPHQTGRVQGRGLLLSVQGWQEIGRGAVSIALAPRVRHLPVFRSSSSLRRYLLAPAFREMVMPVCRLAEQDVELLSLAELRSAPPVPRGVRARKDERERIAEKTITAAPAPKQRKARLVPAASRGQCTTTKQCNQRRHTGAPCNPICSKPTVFRQIQPAVSESRDPRLKEGTVAD